MKQDVKFDLDVGDRERHRISVVWRQMWGTFEIAIDRQPVVKRRYPVQLRRHRSHVTTSGTEEQHEVRIEHTWPRLFAGFRRQQFYVYADGAFIGEY